MNTSSFQTPQRTQWTGHLRREISALASRPTPYRRQQVSMTIYQNPHKRKSCTSLSAMILLSTSDSVVHAASFLQVTYLSCIRSLVANVHPFNFQTIACRPSIIQRSPGWHLCLMHLLYMNLSPSSSQNLPLKRCISWKFKRPY